MALKVFIASLLVVCIMEIALAQDSDSGEQPRALFIPQEPRAQRVVVQQRPSIGYQPRPTYNAYDRPAKYSFAYRARAEDGYGNNNGYGANDNGGYVRGRGGRSAEFGHSEARDGGRTTGAYFTDLPDGRRQRVDYYVAPYSGYVARVTYTDNNGRGRYA